MALHAVQRRRFEAFTTDAKIIRLTRRRVAFLPGLQERRGRFSTAIETRLILKIYRGLHPRTYHLVGSTEKGGTRH